MKMLHLMLLALSLGFAGLMLTGCEEEKSPLEKAADNVGDAVEDAGDAVEDAADDIADKVKD